MYEWQRDAERQRRRERAQSGRMTPRALKAWRLRLDLSQEGLAHWLGVSRSTVNRWEGGLAPIPKMVALLEGYRDGWDATRVLRQGENTEARIARLKHDPDGGW